MEVRRLQFWLPSGLFLKQEVWKLSKQCVKRDSQRFAKVQKLDWAYNWVSSFQYIHAFKNSTDFNVHLQNKMLPETKIKIRSILNICVDGALRRTKNSRSYRPFHEALLTKSLVNASAFERSFSTSFGQGPIEQLSVLIANDNGFICQRQKITMVNLFKGADDEIHRIMAALRDGERRPNWKSEVEKLSAFAKGDTIVRRVISDLWLQKDGIEYFFSIKTVKPNLDQTENAKRDMLTLKAHNPLNHTFFCLYYNPGGEEKSSYNWTMPFKIFDIKNDDCVLIGKDYWNTIGGPETYKELLEVFEEVGLETRPKILNM